VCTVEKANSALNKLIEEQRLHELACIVVDEAHMVADASRCGRRRCRRPAGAWCL
jgi:replicative superfamily II helicase